MRSSLRNILLILPLFVSTQAIGQLGGQRAFEFLNIPANARLAALGGVNLTTGTDDPGMILSNPALLNESWHNHLTVNRLGYFADINQISVNYTRHFENLGLWSMNVTYLDYGEFQQFDNIGFASGTFNVAEYAVSISHSRGFGPFKAGGTLKLAVSDIAAFNASSVLFDFGGLFKHPEKDLTVGLTIKNLGLLVSDYTDESNSQLPLDVQLGVTYKPEFMPFRFSLTARNLNRDNVVFFDPSGNSLIGQNSEPGLGEKIFRRLVIGTELILHDSFQLRFGYNHLLRQELKLEEVSGGAGFSFGFMLKIKRFEFSYGRALYHTAGGSNVIQLNTDLTGLVKKKN